MNSHVSSALVAAVSFLLLATPLRAQTTAGIVIGGPGSLSSEGSSDPGLLNDDLTPAAAILELTLDTVAATLEITVENTSPVSPGIPNPVITDVFVNAPPAVTGASLVSQTASSGAMPFFLANFDPDLTTNPNFNGADGFGAFSLALMNPGGISGAIANANADTLPAPPGSLAIGPVTFLLSLSGNLAGLTAADFVATSSVIPPGSNPTVGVAKFQGGGAGASASGFIGPEAGVCPTSVALATVLGAPCGATLDASPPIMGHVGTLVLDGGSPGASGVLMISPAGAAPTTVEGCDVFLNLMQSWVVAVFTTDANGDATFEFLLDDDAVRCGRTFVMQAAVASANGPLTFGEISNAFHLRLGS
jgi:hypothetical protein